MMNEKTPYEKPTIEIVEFMPEESIAVSSPEGAGLYEEIWGNE